MYTHTYIIYKAAEDAAAAAKKAAAPPKASGPDYDMLFD